MAGYSYNICKTITLLYLVGKTLLMIALYLGDVDDCLYPPVAHRELSSIMNTPQ